MAHSIESIASTRKKTKETIRVESLLPLELREKSTKLIELLQDYYTHINEQDQASYEINSINNARDIDYAAEKYLDLIQKEIAVTVPKNLVADRVKLYKALMKYYSVRGSQESIELFFKILFNDNVEVYYPKKDMLIPSSGNWDAENTSFYLVTPIDQVGRYTPSFQIQVRSGSGYGSFAVGDVISGVTYNASTTVLGVDENDPTILTVRGLPERNLSTGDPIDLYTFTIGETIHAETTIDLSTFTVGETVTGQVSSSTATVVSVANDEVVVGSASGNFSLGEKLTGGTSTVERYLNSTEKLSTVTLTNFATSETVTGEQTAATGTISSVSSNVVMVHYSSVDAKNAPVPDFFQVGELITSGGASAAKSEIESINNKTTLTFSSGGTSIYTVGDMVQGMNSGAIGTVESINAGANTMLLTGVFGAFRNGEGVIVMSSSTSAHLYSHNATTAAPVIDAYLTLRLLQVGEIVLGGTSGALGVVTESTNSGATILVTSGAFSATEAITGKVSRTKRKIPTLSTQYRLALSNLMVGETVTGASSGKTGVVQSIRGSTVTLRNVANQAFTVGEKLVGSLSLVKRKISVLTAGSSNVIRNVYVDNQQVFRMNLRSASGVFQVGEIITGNTSGIYATVVSTTETGGVTTRLTVKNASGNFAGLESITGGTSGKTAQIAQVYSNGIYLDNRGFLDDGIKLQDSHFYQQFSYVIRTGNNSDLWRDAFNRLVHPAGFIFFGEILLLLLGVEGEVRGVLKNVSVNSSTRIVATIMPHSQPGLISDEDLPVLVLIEIGPMPVTVGGTEHTVLATVPTGTNTSERLHFWDSNAMELYASLDFNSIETNYIWDDLTIATVINTPTTFNGYTLGVSYY